MSQCYGVILHRQAEKALRKSPQDVAWRADEALLLFGENPRLPECMKLTERGNEWKYRVGAWRVLYTIEDDHLIVFVIETEHHRKAYNHR